MNALGWLVHASVARLGSLGAALLLLMAASCSLEPRYQRPAAPIPRRWSDAEPTRADTSTRTRTSWQRLFLHPGLRSVVGKALGHNRDLRVAAAEILIARAEYGLARSGLYPNIELGADAAVRVNLKGQLASESYQLGVGTTAYELDLFGRVRSSSHAALEAYLASQAGGRALRLTLIADTASAWLNLAAQQSLLAIAEQTQVSADESVKVTRSRLDGGVGSELDVRQAETVLAQARSDAASYRTSAAQARNALMLLAGRELDSAELPGELADGASLLAEVPSGLPSSVLLARPDVLQAEHMLKAANANIGAARAAFFPRLSLTAIGGLMSEALASLLTLGAAGFTLAPSVAMPIFSGGANEARLEQAKARRALYLADYERSIQRAFREVADALARRSTIEEQLSAQEALVNAADASYRLSDARYRAGADNYLVALDAQRTLYTARRTFVLAQLSRADNLVELYRVFGGG